MCICYVTPWLPRGRTQETGAGDRAPRLLTPLIASTAAVLLLVLTDAEHVQKLPSVVTASNMGRKYLLFDVKISHTIHIYITISWLLIDS